MATATFVGSGTGSGNGGGFLGYITYPAANAGTYFLMIVVSNQGLPGLITDATDTSGNPVSAPALSRFISLSSVYTQFAVYGGLTTANTPDVRYTWYAGSNNTSVAKVAYSVVPSSGRTLLSPVVGPSTSSVLNVSLTTTVALNSGDVVFGCGGFNPEKSGGVSRDTDTTDGSWSELNTSLMTSGPWIQSQAFSQYKNVTGGANQTWNVTADSSNTGTGRAVLFTIAELRDQPHWGILAQ